MGQIGSSTRLVRLIGVGSLRGFDKEELKKLVNAPPPRLPQPPLSSTTSTAPKILRLRFSDRNPLYAVTLKAAAVLENFVSQGEKEEEELDLAIERACATEQMSEESRILRRVRGIWGFRDRGAGRL
ncbi:hypothetical protein M0R45_008548 [Rubus argutus]|uniref:Uncharacterized protein n=1 Tax=Rubus argutus TaxID=59490 RepID=A0AAW1Y1N0_RUBAR